MKFNKLTVEARPDKSLRDFLQDDQTVKVDIILASKLINLIRLLLHLPLLHIEYSPCFFVQRLLTMKNESL